jgi:hypothetical protein
VTGIIFVEGDSLADGKGSVDCVGTGTLARPAPRSSPPADSSPTAAEIGRALLGGRARARQPSRITCAMACSAVCEIESAAFFTPSRAANSAATP